MTNATANEILRLISTLDTDEQPRLIDELIPRLRHLESDAKIHTIQEFRGVGKELWHSVDVDEYIRKEREAYS